MSQQPPDRPQWSDDRQGEDATRPSPEATQPFVPVQQRRRRGWLVPAILAAVVVVLAAVAAYLLLRDDPEPAAPGTPTPAAEATPTPSPTEDTRAVSPDELEPRVDATIVDTAFTLTEAGWATDEEAVAAGAREALRGAYSDGTTEVAVTAAAFDTIEAQDAHAEQVVADLEAAGAQVQGEGTVYVDNTGHYWYVMHDDGQTASIVWRTDDGVVLSLTGPPDAVQQVYDNMLI
ncbi:hypothetical protein [Georgenia sp. AZ-5]|uniref:hypothetical protein n=1 Tax=Georgenia sp. AZ-5 TaxID=3367526 RepID=UPI0037548264